VRADEVEDLQRQIDELSKLRQMSEEDATKPLEAELKNIKGKVAGIKQQLVAADQETVRLEQDIDAREDDLAESYQYLAIRARSYYKLSRQFSPFLTNSDLYAHHGLTHGEVIFLASKSATILKRNYLSICRCCSDGILWPKLDYRSCN
jgi:hypothetical protein